MTDAISCSPEAMEADIDVERDPRDASTWLGRRSYSFGASEAHALLVICGKRSAESAPRWMLDEYIKETRTRLGVMPMLLARKAGLRRAQTQNRQMQLGTERERDVMRVFKQLCIDGTYGDIDPDSIRHCDDVPNEWVPLVDRACPQLASSPDSWCRDIYEGALIGIEVKCSWESYATRYGGAPPHYISQCQARSACEGTVGNLLVEGVEWANERRPDGPVLAWDVGRDDGAIAEIRECARQLWERVEETRKGMR